MSANLDLVRSLYAAWERGDFRSPGVGSDLRRGIPRGGRRSTEERGEPWTQSPTSRSQITRARS
jgi:hypothetical protein